MKLLIIGGTRFVGHHIAQTAIHNGHQVTLFNRGRTEATLEGEYEMITGDRNLDLDKLSNLKFDAVIDTCAYFPKQVQMVIDVVKQHIPKYLLISTISTYKPYKFNYTEDSELKPVDMSSEKITAETYGPLKVGCEKVLVDAYGDNAVIIRPGYIVGDRDYTDRFTYWSVMMKYLDRMPIPKANDLLYQFIDVKDLAQFTIHSLEQNLNGAYHVIGPKDPLLYADFIHLCRDIINPGCELVEIEDDWFIRNKKQKGHMFPTYNDNFEGRVLFSGNNQKAIDAGLTFRPLEETIIDAIQWYDENREGPEDIKAGLPFEELKKLIR